MTAASVSCVDLDGLETNGGGRNVDSASLVARCWAAGNAAGVVERPHQVTLATLGRAALIVIAHGFQR